MQNISLGKMRISSRYRETKRAAQIIFQRDEREKGTSIRLAPDIQFDPNYQRIERDPSLRVC